KTFYPCCFDAYIFYGAEFVVDNNKITYFERLIKKNDEVVEQVAQDVLRSQRNRNTTHAQPRDNRCNIIAQVAEKKDEPYAPDYDRENEDDALYLLYLLSAMLLSPDIIFQKIS